MTIQYAKQVRSKLWQMAIGGVLGALVGVFMEWYTFAEALPVMLFCVFVASFVSIFLPKEGTDDKTRN